MTYVLFGSTDESGTPIVQVQQGKYTGEFDVATAAGNTFASQTMDWVFDSGDEILDLSSTISPVLPAGLYFASALFWWNESETGAAITLTLALAGGGATTDMDLGVVHPDISAGGNGSLTASRLAATDDQVIAASILHSRASTAMDPSDPLTGGFEAYVTRIF